MEMSSRSSSGSSDSGFDVEELLQFQTRCEELRKEKDILRESQSQSFQLIRKLELHVKTLSQTHTDDIKRTQNLEKELRNCSQEIDYLQDQLNSRDEEVHSLVKQIHSLELKLADMNILEEKVGSLKQELESCNLKRVLLEQELTKKEIELKKSYSLIERLEETMSSLAFMYQCETESMKLELLNLEQSFVEAKKLQEEDAQEKMGMIELIHEAQKATECLREENREFKEKLQRSEMNTKVFCQNIEQRFNSLPQLQGLPSSYEIGRNVSAWEDDPCLLSKPTIMGAAVGIECRDKSKKLSCHEYEILVEQLKKELRSEKLKAKEEAEDLIQEMAELRYHLTSLLEDECTRRARIEQLSLQRITELEALIHKEHKS